MSLDRKRWGFRAGGTYGANGELIAFSYDLGPYIAYSEFSPYKIVSKISIDGDVKASKTCYLTIPDLTEPPHTFSQLLIESAEVTDG